MGWKAVFLMSLLVVTPSVGIPLVKQARDASLLSSPATQSYSQLPRENHVVFANGVVEGRQRDVPLRFELTGRLASLEVSEGDKVSQGETLARLDREVWEHEVAKAESAVAYAQAEKERVISGVFGDNYSYL